MNELIRYYSNQILLHYFYFYHYIIQHTLNLQKNYEFKSSLKFNSNKKIIQSNNACFQIICILLKDYYN